MEHIAKKVKEMVFGLLSTDDLLKMSSAKIVTPELYDKEGYPVDGGLMDIRLGVIDPGLRCKTCGGKLKDCVGHFGHIELARPVVHIKYVRYIHNILNSLCSSCGMLLAPEAKLSKHIEHMEKIDDVEIKRNAANAFINSMKNVRVCPYCKAKQYKIILDKPTTFMENDKRLNPIEIKVRFGKLSDKNIFALGFDSNYARPEWMILTVLPIPPVTMRPSITLETGERSEDDLTHKLGDIVRINQRLFENINAGAPEVIIEDLWDLLQYHITTYFDNTTTQIPPARHRSGQPLKSLTERIKSKEGRFRHNLAGKRVNFAARTVISPDPMIRFNEVGVPLSIALELTVPEVVTEWNINWLKEFIRKGPDIYPGANYVARPDGKKKKITDDIKEQLIEELQPGYVVERHLLNGDISIFNRQPSLHRMSIMCHKVRVLPGKSFRLNPAVCNPYNADFDGDEMNLHIPQTEEARSEADTLMQVQTQIITPKNGLNIIGCIEDAITGNYLLSKELQLKREDAVELLISIGIDDLSRLKKGKTVSGKDVFSVLLPADFNFIGFSKSCTKCEKCTETKCDIDACVFIKNGELASGIIDKNTIGEENGSLLRALHARYGDDVTMLILERIFRLGMAVLLKYGFTTAISDTDLDENALNEIRELIAVSEKKVQKLVEDYNEARLEAMPGYSLHDTLEIKILGALNNVRNDIGKFIKRHMKGANPISIMIQSGANANIINLVSMAACVGQQALRGRRIERGYMNRTLSLFKEHDLSPASRGFIANSYKSGLNPVEFFFGAMTGRDSLMDTALRTPKSGYLYRRLANALQDLKVEYDYTVRSATGKIVQFNYGIDNIDVSKSENGKINVDRIIKLVVGK